MPSVIAQKIGMTQVFNEDGSIKPATILVVPDQYVTQVKSSEKDGYKAIQVGASITKKNPKPQQHIQKKVNSSKPINKFFEIEDELEIGTKLDAQVFKNGDKVKLVGYSKGKGFAGTIKRHNFHRGPESHGSRNVRQPGSIGAQQPQRVIKGKKMPGRMGGGRSTVKNLEIISVLSESRLIVSGSVPGSNKSFVLISRN